MTDALREPLGQEPMQLLQVIHEPFAQAGDWPIWQYVDLTLDTKWGLDATAVLATLPTIRHHNPAMWSSKYALTWHTNAITGPPLPDQPIGLTVAGLRHLPESQALLGGFLKVVMDLVEQQRMLVPSPKAIVEATVSSEAIAEQLSVADSTDGSEASRDDTIHKLRLLIEHEPILWSAVQSLGPEGKAWAVRVPPLVRLLRGVTTIDQYLDRIIERVAPAVPPSVPTSAGALDLPYAVGYLDAVWMSRTGEHLFSHLDAASVGRLTQPCGTEEEFNSLMSALADVLGRMVLPGKTAPPQRGALEALRSHLSQVLDSDVLDRVEDAIETLIALRHIRVSTQHSDARHRAVAVFERLGLAFPPVTWEEAWTRVAGLARGSIDVLREEIHVGLPVAQSDESG